MDNDLRSPLPAKQHPVTISATISANVRAWPRIAFRLAQFGWQRMTRLERALVSALGLLSLAFVAFGAWLLAAGYSFIGGYCIVVGSCCALSTPATLVLAALRLGRELGITYASFRKGR